jgi:hypothetical protein
MKKLRRKPCDGAQCNDPAFFRQSWKTSTAAAPFLGATSTGDAPTVQKQEAPQGTEEEKK